MSGVPSTFHTDLARVFRALGDPTRLAILARLARGERCVCDLTAELGASQSRLSFHLKTLKTAGLIGDRPEGRMTFYSLQPGTARRLRRFFEDFPRANPGGKRS